MHMAIKGIKKRWLINFLSLMTFILIILSLCFSFIVKEYFYNAIEKSILDKADNFADMFNSSTDTSIKDFNEYSRKYINNSMDNGFISIIVFDTNGLVIESSVQKEYQNQENSDFYKLDTSKNKYKRCISKISTGQKIMSVTKEVYNESGELMGYIRFITSLEQAAKAMGLSVLFVFLVGIIIITFVIISNLSFMKSILDPVSEIGAIAKRIAQGDLNARIVKQYDDEIGGLCDTINYMAQELENSEKLKNDFISSVSHEIRTPLTAIKGWAETIQTVDLKNKETAEKGMKIIINESERLSGIVEELLDFSSIQNGRMTLRMNKMDILAELDEAVYMFKERARSESKILRYNSPASISPVYGDQNRLRQVFINIIDNAIKYTDKYGEIVVSISEEDSYIKVTVSDNGCGISKEHLPKVKEKFYKSNQTKRGSGIGLAIADEIISLHSGRLEVQSESGHGTTVTIIIPINNKSIENK